LKNKKHSFLIWWMVGLPLFWIIVKSSGWYWEGHPILTTVMAGLSIVGASFLLCWGAEVAQKDISQTLALAFLALIAVLPEYAVDMYFTWTAGKNSVYIPYALANMTGANRLLIGFGWALVVILYWITKKAKGVELEKSHKIEISYLCLATLYSFVIPIKGSLSIFDAIILISLFGFYITTASKAGVIEPEIVGPALEIASLSTTLRRVVVILLFLYSGFAIFVSSEPFAESLIKTGKIFRIDEFILVQWLAPLASESPEIIAASLFVFKAKPSMGIGTLISSKVNQWTLLVGMIPIIFCISSGKISAMVIDSRQIEELFLTSAQSIFAVAILANLNISIKEALILSILFFTQLIIPTKEIRLIYSFVYLGLTLFILFKEKRRLKNFLSFTGLNIR